MSKRHRRLRQRRPIPPGPPQLVHVVELVGVKGLPQVERSEPLTPAGAATFSTEGGSDPDHDCPWCRMAGIEVLADGRIVSRA